VQPETWPHEFQQNILPAMGEAARNQSSETTRTPERRRHRVYITRNTEYHFRDGFCVAVRDRRTGDFLPGHLAIKRRLHGGLKFFPNGAIIPNAGDPKPGEALYFAADGRDLVTSPLERVDRPAKKLVDAYPDLPQPAPGRTA
jgi:hypothetical protein